MHHSNDHPTVREVGKDKVYYRLEGTQYAKGHKVKPHGEREEGEGEGGERDTWGLCLYWG